MCDVFSRLFKGSTNLKNTKYYNYLQDNQKRETENIQILQSNRKLSANPLSIKPRTPFTVQKVDLSKTTNQFQNHIEKKANTQQLSKSLNRNGNELIPFDLKSVKIKNKEKSNLHTPVKKEISHFNEEIGMNFDLNKTLDDLSFSYLHKQTNLALTTPKLQPQLQVRHLDFKASEKPKRSASRSQMNSSRLETPSSNFNSRGVNKMKIKMKSGRFLSKKEVDCDNDYLNSEKTNVDPQKFKRQITHIEKLINKNREKMRSGCEDDNKSNDKGNNKEGSEQLTPRLRKTSQSITPNLEQFKKAKKTSLPSSFNENKNQKMNTHLDLSDINIDEKSDFYEDLNAKLNSTLNTNLNDKLDSNLDENIDFDDFIKNSKISEFGSQFDFLFGEDEMIHHKDSLTDSNEKDNKDQEIIMIDQNFWNLHLSNKIQLEENPEQNEELNECDLHSSMLNSSRVSSTQANSEKSPFILESSINSPMEQNASNAISSTLFSWELAGYVNYLSDM